MSTDEDTDEILLKQGSLRHLVEESFLTLEKNINDIIAYEEESAQRQTAFRNARALFATPSERAIKRMPSNRALGELKQMTTHFETGDVTELQLELERATSDYELFGENPFGIKRDSTKPAKKKRISFSDEAVDVDGETLRVIIKERLDFSESTLKEYAKESSKGLSSNVSIDADTEKEVDALSGEQYEQFLTPKESMGENEFYTPDSSLMEENSYDTEKEEEASMRAAKEAVNSSAGKSTQQGSREIPDLSGGKKSKKGENEFYTPDSSLMEEDSDDTEKEEEASMRAAKEAVYSSAGKSTQQGSREIPDLVEEKKTRKKRKFGERFKNLAKRFIAWIRNRVEAFVASFKPKDQLIVVTEMG
jgi:hypothetical protein